MSEPRTIMTGIVFGESPRWHDGLLWFSDWARQEIITVTPSGHSETVLSGLSEGFGPACIDWLPDGRLLVVSGQQQALLRREADGTLARHADLSAAFGHPNWNEVNVDSRGNAFVNNIAFDFPGGEFAPGIVAVVTPDGSARVVAEGFGFPNGMAVTPDDSTLIVAESYAHQLTAFDIAPDGGLSNRRVWAYLGMRPRRTASPWTPRARSGTPTCPTSTAGGSPRVGRCCRPSRPISAASPAPWAERLFTSWQRTGPRGPRCSPGRRPARFSPSTFPWRAFISSGTRLV